MLSPAPGIEPHPYLVIVGDGELRRALESQAERTGLSDSIRFCGFKNQSELPRYFELSTVFVLPSRHEPWGLIVNEAMNAGRPCIVSDEVGCQPDLITDGVEGCVFPAGDIPALALALRKVLQNEESAARMGRNALTRIVGWSFEQDVQGLRSAIAQATGRFVA
jgi:glycosyltransferase involved in cell wall biosynthesis